MNKSTASFCLLNNLFVHKELRYPPFNQDSDLPTGSNTRDSFDNMQENNTRNEGNARWLETGNPSAGTRQNLDNTCGDPELQNVRNETSFIINDTQYFVCGWCDYFFDQYPDYICKKCNRRNLGHYKKFCLLQQWQPQPEFFMANQQAEQARIDFPELFCNKPFSIFTIGLFPIWQKFLEHFLTETPETQHCPTTQKYHKQVLFRDRLPTSQTIPFLSTLEDHRSILWHSSTIMTLMIWPGPNILREPIRY